METSSIWKVIAIHILGIAGVCISLAFYTGHRDEVLAGHEIRIKKVEDVNEEQTKMFAITSEKLGRVEEQLRYLNDNYNRIAKSLETRR